MEIFNPLDDDYYVLHNDQIGNWEDAKTPKEQYEEATKGLDNGFSATFKKTQLREEILNCQKMLAEIALLKCKTKDRPIDSYFQ